MNNKSPPVITEETRRKLSENMKARWRDPVQREAILCALHRAMTKPETRKKVSSAVKLSLSRPEVIEKLRAITKRNWQDPETRKRMLDGYYNAISKPEISERIQQARINRVVSKETRAKLSAHGKARWADPEKRKLMIIQIKRLNIRNMELRQTPEFLQKMREARKKVLADPTKGPRHLRHLSLGELNDYRFFRRKRYPVHEALALIDEQRSRSAKSLDQVCASDTLQGVSS